MARKKCSTKERILSKVKISNAGCWEWQGYISSNGYGQISIGSRTDNTRASVSAHRISYREFVGKLIDGLQIDHLCKNRRCVNPEHLEQVTAKENVHRSNALWKQEAARTHCPQGHEYSENNTYTRNNRRSCRECSLERSKQAYRKKNSNVIDGMPLWAQLAARTHCNKGHEFSESNTRVYNNSRRCKTCDYDAQINRRHSLSLMGVA